MSAAPLLELEDLTVVFSGTRRPLTRRRPDVRAVEGVSLTVRPGETLGLVGESGSGKSTLGRAVLGLVPPSSGTVRVGGQDITSLDANGRRAYRRQVQAVFQDPFGSLNPTKTIAQSLGAPIKRHLDPGAAAVDARIDDLLGRVGLNPAMKHRYPYEFSGGQRQRIAIARALSLEPSLIVLDEAVSALDVSVQSQVINLLEGLQADLGVAYLFIAHDLAVVRHVSHRVAVMYRGRIVEQGSAEQVCAGPRHPYSQLLLAAAPDPDPHGREQRRARRQHLGDQEPAASADGGCVFFARCPHATERCAEVAPGWTALDDGGAACHLLDDVASRSASVSTPAERRGSAR